MKRAESTVGGSVCHVELQLINGATKNTKNLDFRRSKALLLEPLSDLLLP